MHTETETERDQRTEVRDQRASRSDPPSDLRPPTSALCPPPPPTASEAGAILFLRYRGYGVKFHTNICGKMYSLVADPDATRFTDPAELMRAADHHKIPWTECVMVCP